MSASSVMRLSQCLAVIYLLLALWCKHYDVWLTCLFLIGSVMWIAVYAIWVQVKRTEGD